MATRKILVLFLFLIILATNFGINLPTRPTRTSVTLLYFTQAAINKPTVLAPISIWGLMAALSFGSVGDTEKEIFKAFALYSNRSSFNNGYKQFKKQVLNYNQGGVYVINRNFYFVDHSLKDFVEKDFRNMLIDTYDTIFMPLDFKDSKAAAQKADALIVENVPEVSGFFYPKDFKQSLILISNVVLFIGNWSLPFHPSNTRREKIKNGDQVVEMMYQSGKVPYSYIESMKANVMELTYGEDKKYCMLIITPEDGVSVRTVYLTLDTVTLGNIFDKLESDVAQYGLQEIDIKLPKYRKLSNLILNKPLNDMGIHSAFEPEYARFDKMINESIYIETIEQSASIMLSETGTVAFATTPLKVLEPFIEQVNPPCILFILEKSTKTLLFGTIFP